MKKNILFVLPSFEVGGTTVSTRHLISVLDKEKYNISVLPLLDDGILKWMFTGVDLLPSNYVSRALAIKGWNCERNWSKRILTGVIRFFAKSKFFQSALFKYAYKTSINKRKFDTVVSCEEGLSTSLVGESVKGKKIAWVRCDYKRVYEARGNKIDPIYNCFDYIVCVAEQTRESFVSLFTNLEIKTVCIHNPQDSQLIINNALYNDHDSRFTALNEKIIVSVGRLDKVKRFESIPAIARSLVEKNLRFKWFIIGDGGEKQNIEEEIKKNNIQGNVIMLGAKSNPHFYIKQADLYVCLSLSEACPRVINEAKILGTPVVSTDFPTVYEYLEDGVNGRIVPLDHITNTVYELLTDDLLYQRIKKEIDNFTFDNSPLVERLEQIL